MKKSDNDLSHHILPNSATMVGVCIMVISIVKNLSMDKVNYLIDKAVAIDSLLFMVNSAIRFEWWTEVIFIFGLISMTLITIVLLLRLFSCLVVYQMVWIKGYKIMNKIKHTLIVGSLLLVQPLSSFAVGTDDMFGSWASLTLQGDFQALSPEFGKNFKWLIMNQVRTRDDSAAKGVRFTENLLFSQVGYQINDNASIWLGYTHDWIHPLNKSAYQESRPYEDFLWSQDIFGDFKFMARTRMEHRINESTGNTGHRARQLFQVSHALEFIDEKLSVYVGDEVMFYLNKNNFGKQGFTENRIFSGLSYQFTSALGADLGYMGQYVDNVKGNNLFTHNLQFNLRYKF